jgi:hypothetical protein
MKWHTSALRSAWLPALALLILVAAACGSDSGNPAASPTAAPLPAQVVIPAEPEGITLEDPRFDPLPGARAFYGRLGGTVYRIEVPDQWNGTLVLYLHGVRIFNPIARAENPPRLMRQPPCGITSLANSDGRRRRTSTANRWVGRAH